MGHRESCRERCGLRSCYISNPTWEDELAKEPKEAEKWEGTRAVSVTEDRKDEGSPICHATKRSS